MSDIFEKAQKIAKNEILVYINADIIVVGNFLEVVKNVMNEEKFLMVGRRWDIDIKHEINMDEANWQEEFREKAVNEGKLHSATGIDYFVFKKGLWSNIPAFAVGRVAWDNWFLYYARKHKAKLIDATEAITVIHQNHRYINLQGDASEKQFNPWKTVEANENLKLAGGYGYCYTIDDAEYTVTREYRIDPKRGNQGRYSIMLKRAIQRVRDRYLLR